MRDFSKYFEANRELWNRRTPVHLASSFYDVDSFLKGRNSLTSMELEMLGTVEGKRILHLQCHFGQDTLSLARLGAEVVGVDFSPEAIREARRLNERLGLEARFVECNVYDLPERLDERFDLVYTSFGALCWLPDLHRWAEVVQHFLIPGGRLALAEFHPTLYLFDFESGEPAFHYFDTGTPYEEISEGTYTEGGESLCLPSYFWVHSLDNVLSPLLERGFHLLRFREYDFSPFNCFPNMKERRPGEYVFQLKGLRLPHVFALAARLSP